jgi:hypothetical protein
MIDLNGIIQELVFATVPQAWVPKGIRIPRCSFCGVCIADWVLKRTDITPDMHCCICEACAAEEHA